MSDAATVKPTAASRRDVEWRNTPVRRFIYWLFWWFCLIVLTVFFRLRRFHMERIPRTGACLIVGNHQSHLDPPAIGVCNTTRPTHFIARMGLFKNRLFGWLIFALNSIPIREESGDLGAIKEVLARLEKGVPVLIFPEGSRSNDGRMHEFKRGIALLVKRAKCPVVPAAVEGAFDAYPRGGRPRFWGKRVAVMIGKPIPHEELMKDGPDAMRLELRARLRAATNGRYPPPGPPDAPSDPGSK
jgi:1-acyl-sn-glycerol-3-phosphate acyltransferase